MAEDKVRMFLLFLTSFLTTHKPTLTAKLYDRYSTASRRFMDLLRKKHCVSFEEGVLALFDHLKDLGPSLSDLHLVADVLAHGGATPAAKIAWRLVGAATQDGLPEGAEPVTSWLQLAKRTYGVHVRSCEVFDKYLPADKYLCSFDGKVQFYNTSGFLLDMNAMAVVALRGQLPKLKLQGAATLGSTGADFSEMEQLIRDNNLPRDMGVAAETIAVLLKHAGGHDSSAKRCTALAGI